MRFLRYLHRSIASLLLLASLGLACLGADWIGLLTFVIGVTTWAVGEALFRE